MREYAIYCQRATSARFKILSLILFCVLFFFSSANVNYNSDRSMTHGMMSGVRE